MVGDDESHIPPGSGRAIAKFSAMGRDWRYCNGN